MGQTKANASERVPAYCVKITSSSACIYLMVEQLFIFPTDYQLRMYFQPFGQILDVRIFADKGYAFIK